MINFEADGPLGLLMIILFILILLGGSIALGVTIAEKIILILGR